MYLTLTITKKRAYTAYVGGDDVWFPVSYLTSPLTFGKFSRISKNALLSTLLRLIYLIELFYPWIFVCKNVQRRNQYFTFIVLKLTYWWYLISNHRDIIDKIFISKDASRDKVSCFLKWESQELQRNFILLTWIRNKKYLVFEIIKIS